MCAMCMRLRACLISVCVSDDDDRVFIIVLARVACLYPLGRRCSSYFTLTYYANTTCLHHRFLFWGLSTDWLFWLAGWLAGWSLCFSVRAGLRNLYLYCLPGLSVWSPLCDLSYACLLITICLSVCLLSVCAWICHCLSLLSVCLSVCLSVTSVYIAACLLLTACLLTGNGNGNGGMSVSGA
jgi:hypothetical protein